MLNAELLADAVNKQRRLMGMTQAEVAGLAGVSLRSIKLIEAGQANPGLQQLTQLLNVIGLKLVIHPNT